MPADDPESGVRGRHADAAKATFTTDEYGILVGGAWTESATGATFPVRDPTTGQRHATVQACDEADVDRAVESARRGFEEWSAFAPRKRASLLGDVADAIRAERERLARAVTLDAGRPIREANAEVPQVADRFDYFGGLARDLTGETVPAERYDLVTTYREPHGVVGAIVPWNIPLMLAANKLAPALAAGNTVVLKPAEQATACTLELVRIVDGVLPDGVVNAVTGDGDPVGDALVRHPSVRKVAFTGSAETGKSVMRAAADHVTDVTLELGGKGAAIVFPDADIEKAVEDVLMGIFFNAGQVCGATARLYLHDDVAEAFLDSFVERAREIRLGDPLDSETQMGPIISNAQHQRIVGFLSSSAVEAATVRTGGGVPAFDDHDEHGDDVEHAVHDGLDATNFVEPTVITDLDEGAPIACEEVFGPVETVFTWREYDDVIRRANDTAYGLTAGVWTDDYRTLVRATRDLEAGTVTGNLAHRLPTEMPYGGLKESGIGRENGRAVLDAYTTIKSLNADLRADAVEFF